MECKGENDSHCEHVADSS